MLMDSHKSHRKHKKVRKKKKRRHKSSSSSDSTSSEDEWVEAPTASQNSTKSRDEDIQKATAKKEEDNDEWASFSGQFRTREEIQEKRKPKKEERVNLDKLGQSARELNPYWKDGGSGLPEEEKAVVGGGAVGDFGLDWLRRAMRRSKEQALEEKRSLEEVVAERWGSLAKLESLIAEAEEKQRRNSHKSNYDNNDRYQKRKSYDVTNRSDDVTSKRRFMKPNNESSGDEEADHRKRKTDKYGDDEYDKWKKENKRNKTFAKPRDDDEEEEERKEERRERDRRRDDRERDWRSGRHSSSKSSGGWRKKSADEGGRRRKEEDSEEEEEKKDGRRERESTLTSSSSGGWRKKSSSAKDDDGKRRIDDDGDVPDRNASNEPSSRDENKQDGGLVTSSVLTADERNELAAKLVKAEIMGNTELAAELKSRLERAREAAAAPEPVVLTVTDGRGFTQPLAAPTAPSNRADASRGKGGKKVKTHDDSGKRVRYFADDDRFTLQEMFEREKRNTAEDQNEMFARLAGKKIGDDDSARDMDDVFEETASRGGGAREAARADERARARAIGQHQRATRAHDNCSWCLDSQHLLKHLVVAIGSKVYLCLPPHESLTEGHCLIVTSQHVTCCVQADEEVWEEIQVFRKALVDMFLEQDLDCVVFEHAAGFSKFPHLVLQCVPLPKEQGDLAPIYFKKAILECETEWSTNKKLVDLAGSKGGVRRCVPRGLPYFFVDFGMQSGYAHVIEDEHLFPKNFAQEIIGGILDVDHNKWRKPRREKFDDQRKKVVEFTKLWKPFDFTKKSDD